ACTTLASVAAEPYVPGATTRAEAEAHWTKIGASITGAGHLALGTGSGLDGVSEAFEENVELVDVVNADFEGIGKARFGFYKGTLYVVQAELTLPTLPFTKPVEYTPADLDALKKKLQERHGPTSES